MFLFTIFAFPFCLNTSAGADAQCFLTHCPVTRHHTGATAGVSHTSAAAVDVRLPAHLLPLHCSGRLNGPLPPLGCIRGRTQPTAGQVGVTLLCPQTNSKGPVWFIFKKAGFLSW